MIRTMFKTLLVIACMALIPVLLLVIGPVLGISMSAFGVVLTAFFPIIAIGIVIGYIAKKRR